MKNFRQIALGLMALISGELVADCPKIDKTKTFADGIPYCPDITRTNAWGVTSCSFNAATKWRAFNKTEEQQMTNLVQALKDESAVDILRISDNLRMQVCRSKDGDDSFLLAYSKPNIKDFSGPFIMYREGGKTSGIVIESPHERTDNTHMSVKHAFVKSNALALISNGHHKGITKRANANDRSSDWAHARKDLGWVTLVAFKNKFPESVHVHLHGMKVYGLLATDSCGWAACKHTLRSAFIDAFKKAAGPDRLKTLVVREWRFNGWDPGLLFTSQGGKRVDLQRWVGAEIGVRLHNGQAPVVVNTIRNLEADFLKKPRGYKPEVDTDPKDETPVPADMVEDEAEEAQQETPVTQEPEVPVRPDKPAPTEDGKEPDDDLVIDLSKEVEHAKDEIDFPLEVELPSSVENQLVYAPFPKGNKGTKTLACVAIQYSNDLNKFVTKDRCLKAAKKVAEFYGKNSNGKLKLTAKAFEMNYKGDAWKSWEQAGLEAKKQFKANYYIIPNIFKKGGNRANRGIAWMSQFTGWVIDHEVGHLLGTQHAGRYAYDKTGKPTLMNYGDDQSPMGNNGYPYLAPPAYYTLGWAGPKGVAMHKQGTATFELTRISAKKADGPLFGVIVRAENFFGQDLPPMKGKHRDAFISFPNECPKGQKVCAALHLFQGGGTQLVKRTDEIEDKIFTGLKIKAEPGTAANTAKVTIEFTDSVKL